MAYILVLYSSRHGSTKAMAEKIAHGIEANGNYEAMIRTVPRVSATIEAIDNVVPDSGHVYITLDELKHCAGLALGSQVNFGNMSGDLKYFWDTTTPVWLSKDLVNKPAGLFASSASMHGGQESTLLSMMLPLLHHGMIIAGVPYAEPALNKTLSGGTPYGPTHVSGMHGNVTLTDDESELCIALGKRLAGLASKLQG